MNEPTSIYQFEFLVKARTWEEVVQIFKAELGIDKQKQNASDRDINGLFFVQVSIDNGQINEEFFNSIRISSTLAIVKNPLDALIRNAVMNEAYAVETQMRKLLLHVSDLVEGYYEYFAKTLAKDFAKKQDVISKDDLNPITSYLTFDEIIVILGLDLTSWDGQDLTANHLLELIQSEKDIDGIKKKLKNKIQKNTVWDRISDNVLEKKVPWDEIRKELNELKNLRNKAAHFQTLTQKDLVNAKKLSKTILETSKKRSSLSARDFEKLRRATYPQFAEALSSASRTAEILAAYQRRLIDPLGKIDSQMQALRETVTKSAELANSPQMQALINRAASMNSDSIKYINGLKK